MNEETFIGIRDFGTHKAAEFRLKCPKQIYAFGRYEMEDVVRRDLPSLRSTIENVKKHNTVNLGELEAAVRALESEE